MTDANYALIATTSYSDRGTNMASLNIQEAGTYSTAAAQIVVQQASGTNYDSATVNAAVFR